MKKKKQSAPMILFLHLMNPDKNPAEIPVNLLNQGYGQKEIQEIEFVKLANELLSAQKQTRSEFEKLKTDFEDLKKSSDLQAKQNEEQTKLLADYETVNANQSEIISQLEQRLSDVEKAQQPKQ